MKPICEVIPAVNRYFLINVQFNVYGHVTSTDMYVTYTDMLHIYGYVTYTDMYVTYIWTRFFVDTCIWMWIMYESK